MHHRRRRKLVSVFFGRANQADQTEGHSTDENKKFELNDEEPDRVVGGVSVGERVKMDSRMVRYCPGCGKLASVVTGTVIGKMYYEKGGYYFVEVKSDCCGYVERALESICTVQ